MPFEKNNKLGFTPKNDKPLDKQPLSIRLKAGDRDKVRSISDWQDKVRDLISKWLDSENV